MATTEPVTARTYVPTMEDDAQELERLRTENAQLRQALAMLAAAAKAAADS